MSMTLIKKLKLNDEFIKFQLNNTTSNEANESSTPKESEKEKESNEVITFELEIKELEEKREPLGIRRLMEKDHPTYKILGDIKENVKTRSFHKHGLVTLISQVKHSNIDEALEDESWVEAMEEELEQFHKNDVWKLMELPQNKNAIGAKRTLSYKLDEDGKVVRNKAKLVGKGYSQQKGINYTKIFALVARLEAIQILLSLAAFRKIKLYKMNMKSSFLNGVFEEEVYTEKPPGF